MPRGRPGWLLEMTMSRRGWILFVSMGILWGIPYMFIKVAVRDFSAPDVVFARTALGALVLLPLALHRKELRATLAHWRWVLLLAAFEMACPWFLITAAEQQLPSALVGMLISLVPLFSISMIWLFLDRGVLHRGRVIGLLVGFIGVVVLLGLDALSKPLDARSVVETVLAALFYAVVPIVADRKLRGVPPVGMTAVSITAVALVYLPFALLSPAPTPTPASVASLVVLGLACTATAFVIYFALIAEVGPVRSTVITYVNPAVAVVLGIAVLGEPLTWGTVVGFPLVLFGSWLSTRATPVPVAEPA